MEKVPAKVISTEGELVFTHGMHFYHRSLRKPNYIAFQGIFLYKIVMRKKKKVSFKMSATILSH